MPGSEFPTDRASIAPTSRQTERLERLVPAALACPTCKRRDDLVLQEHIVDVWFESGVSHSAVLGRQERMPWPSDLYLEGHDQYRGWFQSSLLVAVHDRNEAPYRSVVTHGFTLDAEGRKMSKSIGNVISPLDVADKRGAEILRLWVSMIDFLEDMRLVARDSAAQRRRPIARFATRSATCWATSTASDRSPETDSIAYDDMQEIDRWALQQFEQMRQRWVKAYDSHQYHLIYHGFHNFCSVTLSSFYLDIHQGPALHLSREPSRHAARPRPCCTGWRAI